MIRDLQRVDDTDADCSTQVCLVGGGTAGIFLAQLLRERQIDVVMLEAGDASARKSEEIGQHCEQRGIRYRGAESGRTFGLGGTSALWGGQMLPLARSDFEARPGTGMGAWPIGYDDLVPHWATVGRLLGLGPDEQEDPRNPQLELHGRYSELRGLSDEFNLRLSKWLPFKRRNFARAFSSLLKNERALTVWLNAAVVGMAATTSPEGNRIEVVTARSTNGRRLQVRASVVVICAGALESTRLLLEFDESNQRAITRRGAPLGRYFSDHLSMTCGRFVRRDRRRYNLAVAPMFAGGLMRTPRLELTAKAQREHRLASAFAHFPFMTHGDTGFDVMRSFLRRRQGEQKQLGLRPGMLGRVALDVSALAYWRGIHRRLWIPRQAELLLQVDTEQLPNSDSRLELSQDVDALGRRRLTIDWRMQSEDVRAMHDVAKIVARAWQSSPIAETAELTLLPPEEFTASKSLYDVYHPTGTLRMGSAPESSVVNDNLRLWGVDNCYVTTTAVFPSAGSANPGMTHLALTARLADKIAAQIRTLTPGLR